jgi:F-type H+-transporting ATPase subunit delta
VPAKQGGREYARAIMMFAPQSFEQVADFFARIIRMRKGSTLFDSLLRHPAIPPADKIEAVMSIARSPLPALIRKIITTLVLRRGIDRLGDVLDELKRIHEEREGIQGAQVSSSEILTDAQQADMSAAIAKYTRKRARIEFRVDPSLIAGYRIKINDQVIDNSIKRELDNLSSLLVATTRA